MSYTVIYTLSEAISWSLGTTRILNFRIGDTRGVYSLPLVN